MVKKYLFLFFAVSICFVAQAQRTELGIWAGGSGYIGDINPTNAIKVTDPAGGFLFRINYNPFWALRLGIAQGAVQAADSTSNNSQNKLRNLSFKSQLTEISGVFEFNMFKYGVKTAYKFSPFVFAGLSAFLFNPQTTYQGTTYDLQAMGTEGQRAGTGKSAYSIVNMSIPFGLGFKYNLGGKTTVGGELGYRYTFTDYLDDVSGAYSDTQAIQSSNGNVAAALADRSGEVNSGVNIGRVGSQRGDAVKKDMFFFVGLSLTYTFVPLKCPTFD